MAPKPLVSPFPGRTFDPAFVRTFDWDASTGHGKWETYEKPIGPNGAVVIRFTVPTTIGTKIKVGATNWGGDSGTQPMTTWALNASAEPLDFVGAHAAWEEVAGAYMVVSADDPDAGSHAPITRPGKTRSWRPLVAGKAMFFNITHIGPVSEVRVQI